MSLIGAASVVAAAGYLVVTIVFQFPPLSGGFPLLDRLGVVPRWKFFTQAGATFDVGVEMRARRLGGQLGDWTPVATVPGRRPWHFLWYPEQYGAGICWEAIYTLDRRITAARDPSLTNSLAYATILNRCRQEAARLTGAEACQFALVRRRAAAGEPSVVFLSGFHDV